jgi:hypothetical protein
VTVFFFFKFMSEEISSTVEEAVGLQGDRGPGHRPLQGCKPAVTAALATKCAAAVSSVINLSVTEQ